MGDPAGLFPSSPGMRPKTRYEVLSAMLGLDSLPFLRKDPILPAADLAQPSDDVEHLNCRPGVGRGGGMCGSSLPGCGRASFPSRRNPIASGNIPPAARAKKRPVANSLVGIWVDARVRGSVGLGTRPYGPFRSFAISVRAAVMLPPTELPAIAIRLPSVPNSPACAATRFRAA